MLEFFLNAVAKYTLKLSKFEIIYFIRDLFLFFYTYTRFKIVENCDANVTQLHEDVGHSHAYKSLIYHVSLA